MNPSRFWNVRFAARSLACFTILLMSAVAQDKGPVFLVVDHATVCGSNLDPLRQEFTDVGLKPDYGGPHANGVTHMALLGFENGSYLELIAPQTAGKTQGSEWGNLMAGDAGPCAWAVGPDDITAEVARLKAAGVPVTGPQAGSRKRPDGMSVEWQTAFLGTGTPGSTLPFMIQDRTPRAWRVQPSENLKDSGLVGVVGVVIGVNNLEVASAAFRKAFQWAPPIMEDHKEMDAKLAYFPGTPVILAASLDGKGWIAERIQKLGESPVAFLLGAHDFAAVQKKFHLSNGKPWFEQKMAWFDEKKLNGVRLGVQGQ
jgi:hypothetical protein